MSSKKCSQFSPLYKISFIQHLGVENHHYDVTHLLGLKPYKNGTVDQVIEIMDKILDRFVYPENFRIQDIMNYKEHYRQDAIVFDYFGAGQLRPGELRRDRLIIDYCNIRPGMEILDVGSGRGWFSLAASALGAKVTALDLSEHNLKRIRELDPSIDTVLGDACQIPSGDQLYDLIVTLEVLEHIPEPALALNSIKTRLKPGGKLLITVPYKEVIISSLCIHCNQPTPHNAHLHSFDTPSLKRLLTNCGYSILETRLFTHKLMTALRINELTARLPYAVWIALDRLFGLHNDKYHYLAIKASPK